MIGANLLSKLLRRRPSDDQDEGFGHAYAYGDAVEPQRSPLASPFAPIAAALAFAGLAVILMLWLMIKAGDTLSYRASLVPRVIVAVASPGTDAGGGPDGAAPVEPPVTLTPAPSPGLVEETRNGPLPRIGVDGRQPWQVYARPFPNTDKRPRIAIIMANMGLSGPTTADALQRLPGGVTLAFTPYSERLSGWVDKARGEGHEVLLTVPMEPIDYPRNDPGPNTLLTTLKPEQNIERLEWALGRVSGYTGIISLTGSRFVKSASLRPALESLKRRGLMFVDSRSSATTEGAQMAALIQMPYALNNRFLDQDPARNNIDSQLKALEEIARQEGAAVGIGLPYQTTIERLAAWLPTLADKGLVLAPVSAVVDIQKAK